MNANKPRGKFITFEGGEGAGKTTQIARLADRLNALDIPTITTREPGGAPGADSIRSLLVSGATDKWDPISEVLLLYAARREHLKQTIRPALDQGAWVLCDRFADSTMAYQGYGHGISKDFINALHAAVGGDSDLDIAAHAPERVTVIDADSTPEAINDSIWRTVTEKFDLIATADRP